jgi:acetyl esterase
VVDAIARAVQGGNMGRVIDTVRRKLTVGVSGTVCGTLARMGRLYPGSRPEAHSCELLRDIPYRADGHAPHRLDIYRPARPGPWPIVFYVHGGGFHILDKDSHWIMALAFARFGYMVVNISYRLAPRHPFPAAVDDTCAAWAWMVEHAEALGGDLSRVAVAGESAGGNLVAALTLATCQRRPEPWARVAWDTGVVPGATLPFCALLQVSQPERWSARRHVPFWFDGMIRDMTAGYLPGYEDGASHDLADPLVALERGPTLDRPLPPFFAAVGTRDPILDDTRRLEKALATLNVPCEARYYPGRIHAFHALVWDPVARRCWLDALAFVERHLRRPRERFVVDDHAVSAAS